jgi:hypothetical protein
MRAGPKRVSHARPAIGGLMRFLLGFFIGIVAGYSITAYFSKPAGVNLPVAATRQEQQS